MAHTRSVYTAIERCWIEALITESIRLPGGSVFPCSFRFLALFPRSLPYNLIASSRAGPFQKSNFAPLFIKCILTVIHYFNKHFLFDQIERDNTIMLLILEIQCSS